MKKSNLTDIHETLGGTFTENSPVVPEYYEGLENEVRQVREKSGITDLSGRGKLTVSGKDHLKLLQGMLTNDVVKLETGSGNHAAALTVKGRMLADMRTFKMEDKVLIDLDPGLEETLAGHLNKFKLSYRAEITNSTETYNHFHICGPESSSIVESMFGPSVSGLAEYGFIKADYNGSEILVIKLNRTGETGFDILTAADDGESFLSGVLEQFGPGELKPFGSAAFESLRIEAGIPLFGTDMDDSTIPIEAELWDALDFEKGCYIGQEVIARIKWRGRVNWHLVGFMIPDNSGAGAGTKIYNEEKEIGRITSATFSYTIGSSIALGYIRREFREEGQQVLIKSGENSHLKATVCALPFINNFN